MRWSRLLLGLLVTALLVLAGLLALDRSLQPVVDNSPVKWRGAAFESHPVLGWRGRRRAMFKSIYATNPRDYFTSEPIYGPLDLTAWSLSAPPDGAASLTFPSLDRPTLLIGVPAIAGGHSWEINATGPSFPVEEGGRYAIHLRARGSRPRGVHLRCGQALEPWSSLGLGLDLALTEAWQDFDVPFVAQAAEENARLELLVGAEVGDVEVASLSIVPMTTDQRLYGPQWPLAWQLLHLSEMPATFEPSSESPPVMRLTLESPETAKPQDVMLVRERLPVRMNLEYRFVAEVRAERPREIEVVFSQSHPPWHGLGHSKFFDVDSEWRTIAASFRATEDDMDGRIELRVGGDSTPVEFRNVRFAPQKMLTDLPSQRPSATWALRQSRAAAVLSAEEKAIALRYQSPPSGQAFDVQVERGELVVKAGVTYALRFLGRADSERKLRLQLTRNDPSWESLGLDREFTLNADERETRLEFQATASDDAARLAIVAGQSDVPFALRDIEWISPPPGSVVSAVAAGDWQAHGPTPLMRMELQGKKRPVARFLPAASADKLPMLGEARASIGPLEAGQRYRWTFRARAEAPRAVTLAVGPSEDFWSELQCFETRQLSTEWQAYSVDFVASTSLHDGKLNLLVGGWPAWIEIDDTRFGESDEAPPPGGADFTVTYLTNSEGLRDEERPRGRPADAIRVAVLGDEAVFGAGVHADDVVTRQLERQLNATGPAAAERVEVLNFGVCGHDAMQARLVYQTIAQQFAPDVVVAMLRADDATANLTQLSPGKFEPVEDIVAHALGRKSVRKPPPRDFEACVDEMRQLVTACQANRAALVIAAFRSGNDSRSRKLVARLRQEFDGSSTAVVDLGETLLREHPPQDFRQLPDTAWEENEPPNELAHRLAAEGLARFLREKSLLKRVATLPAASAPPVATPVALPQAPVVEPKGEDEQDTPAVDAEADS